jgi:hypothetical protein
MRVVTNEKLILRNRNITQFLLFGALGGIVLFFIFGNGILESQYGVFYLYCLVFPGLFGMMLGYARMNHLWFRPPVPWTAIEEGMKGLGPDYTLYNYLLPANHVLVGPTGVFAITTRFQERPQKIVEGKWQSPSDPLGILVTYMRQEQLGNPTREAKKKALQTQAFLRKLLDDPAIQVQPLVVFVNPNAKVSIEGETEVPVLFGEGNKKSETNLKAYFKSFPRDKDKKDEAPAPKTAAKNTTKGKKKAVPPPAEAPEEAEEAEEAPNPKAIKREPYPTLSEAQQAELDDVLLYVD